MARPSTETYRHQILPRTKLVNLQVRINNIGIGAWKSLDKSGSDIQIRRILSRYNCCVVQDFLKDYTSAVAENFVQNLSIGP